MPQGINRWNVAEQRGVANENNTGTQEMPQGINQWTNITKAHGVFGHMHEDAGKWMAEMKGSKSKQSLNGFIKKHINRKAESQRESVEIDQNGMVEMKRSKSKRSLNGFIRKHTNREAESQRESADAKNQNGMFENESVVKNLILKLKQKTVE